MNSYQSRGRRALLGACPLLTYGCRYFDYSERVPDQLFQDPVHLSPVGSMLFTRRLTDEVLSPCSFCLSKRLIR